MSEFKASDIAPEGSNKAMAKNKKGLYIFPGNTPQEYVDLYYAQQLLKSEMEGKT